MNLLVTGAFALTNQKTEYLSLLGHKVVFMQQESEELPCEYSWIEGIIGNGIFLHHPIENFTSLRYVQLTSAGFDRVPMDYVKEHNIKIFNARGVYNIPMAEFAVSGVLQLYKHNKFFIENQAEHKWEKHRNLLELYGKEILIIGCGNVGTECAKRFRAFGCKVCGVDVTPYQSLDYDEILPMTASELKLKTADVIILTLPLSDDTYHLIDASRLGLAKSNAVLVNISRGGVIDTNALVDALIESKIGGAVLDVFESEPLDRNSLLWDMDNVIITPHNSFVGEGNNQRLWNCVIKNLRG